MIFLSLNLRLLQKFPRLKFLLVIQSGINGHHHLGNSSVLSQEITYRHYNMLFGAALFLI